MAVVREECKCGVASWRPLLISDRVGVRPHLQKQVDHSNVAEAGGAVERRHAAEVLRIDIGVGVEEQHRLVVILVQNCLVQRWFLVRCRIFSFSSALFLSLRISDLFSVWGRADDDDGPC